MRDSNISPTCRREPADRHHRGICTAFHAVRQMPVHARAHRVRRGSLPQTSGIPAGRMSGRQQHLPRPALTATAKLRTRSTPSARAITHVPNATLCLNADCSLTASLADSVPNKIVWFGVNVPIYKETAHELSDAPYCIHCKTEYEYDYITYGHPRRLPLPEVRLPPPDAAGRCHQGARHRCGLVRHHTGHLRSRARGTSTCRGYNIYNAAARSRCRSCCRHRRADRRQRTSQFECGSAVLSSSSSVRHRRA